MPHRLRRCKPLRRRAGDAPARPPRVKPAANTPAGLTRGLRGLDDDRRSIRQHLGYPRRDVGPVIPHPHHRIGPDLFGMGHHLGKRILARAPQGPCKG